jgi:DNA-binding SARP family transcriptional activator/streptogramin lyase
VLTGKNPPSFRLLGHLRIDGASEEIRGLKLRALLAFLLIHAGEVVSTDRLVDAVWGESPPATATSIVHGYVRKLRAALVDSPARLITQAPGYLLELDDAELDIRVFERLADEGRDALLAGDAETARALLAEALELWRGDPLGDLPDNGFVTEERSRLEQRCAEATAERVDADLALGRSGELVAELEALLREQPFQEGPRRQLMLALYRSGRQADALELYRETRRLFVEELGIEPSKSLQELEQAMLRQDASLDPVFESTSSATPYPEPREARRHPWRIPIVLAVLVLLAAGVAVPLATTRGSKQPPITRPAKILATIDLPQPSCCGFGSGAAWGVGHHDDRLRKIDTRKSRVVDHWQVAGFQSGVPLAAAGSIWIPSAAADLVRFNPTSGRVVARMAVHGSQLGWGYLTIWETTRTHQLVRINLKTNKPVSSLRLLPGANNWDDTLAIGDQAVWIGVADEATLDRVDPQTNSIDDRIGGFGDTDSGMPVAVDQNAVWVLRFLGGQLTLFRIDPSRDKIVKRIPVGPPNGSGLAGSLATGGGYVWTGNWNKTISKVDPRTNRVVAVYTLPGNPQNVAFADGSLWVDSYDASKVWRIDPNG